MVCNPGINYLVRLYPINNGAHVAAITQLDGVFPFEHPTFLAAPLPLSPDTMEGLLNENFS